MNLELESRVRTRTAALADANRDLQNEVVRRESAEEELRHSRDELAILSRQLITAQEVERKRIARELHDSVGQALSAIKYSLERGAELSESVALARSPTAIASSGRRPAGCHRRNPRNRDELRPSVLDDLGAASAVSWFCREFAQSSGDRAAGGSLLADLAVPERLSTAVFRSLQELLNNVASTLVRGRWWFLVAFLRAARAGK